MTRWPSMIVIARAVAESIPPDRRTTAVSTIVLDMDAEPKGLASRDFTGRASREGEPNRPRVEVDAVALVEEERQAEDVSVERPRSIQVLRIPDNPLDGEGHSISLRHRERMRPLSPFRRETPNCKGLPWFRGRLATGFRIGRRRRARTGCCWRRSR